MYEPIHIIIMHINVYIQFQFHYNVLCLLIVDTSLCILLLLLWFWQIIWYSTKDSHTFDGKFWFLALFHCSSALDSTYTRFIRWAHRFTSSKGLILTTSPMPFDLPSRKSNRDPARMCSGLYLKVKVTLAFSLVLICSWGPKKKKNIIIIQRIR